MDSLALRRAAAIIRDGGVVAQATEGVWGLACDPFSRAAVERVLRLKKRPVEKGLILIAASPAMFDPELDALEEGRRIEVLESWPGPVTWLVPSRRFPAWVTGGRPTVALRVPGHAQSRRLSALVGSPVVSTSANPTGRPPAMSDLRVRAYFRGALDAIVPGELGGRGTPSEIRDALTGARYRSGTTGTVETRRRP